MDRYQTLPADIIKKLPTDLKKRNLLSIFNCCNVDGERSIDSRLTFFSFPDEEWISLRNTNVIERLNKEFRRRTRPMEILAGEAACYRILAFVSLKMELHWRSNPMGKVNNNLLFFKKLADNNFTQ
jgi:putative transposase